VAALAADEPLAALTASKSLLLMAALWVTVDMLANARSADRCLTFLVLVATAAAALGLAQVVLCPGQEPDYGPPAWLYHRCFRARGPFSIYTTLAGVLTLVLLASLPRLLPGGPFRPRLVPAWLLMLAGLIATYTRGAWIGLAAGAGALLPALRRGRWIPVAGLAVLGALALSGPYELRSRVLKLADPGEAGVTERVHMWRSGLAMWREHPWLGVGPGGVKREYPRYARPEAGKKATSHLHNTPLQILVERGPLGLAAWGWLYAAFFARAIRLLGRLQLERARERALVAGVIAAVSGFLVAGLAEYNFGDSEVAMVAWTLMALPFVVERDLERARDRRPV
jgi:O-antigen ligase